MGESQNHHLLHQAPTPSRSAMRAGAGGGEIVEVQGGHIVRSTGRKDRHSKVCTAKGPRDRRVRLAAHTAIQFYDVQDRLGYDRPSKAVDWLIKKAKTAIDELAELPPWNPTATSMQPPQQQEIALRENKSLPAEQDPTAFGNRGESNVVVAATRVPEQFSHQQLESENANIGTSKYTSGPGFLPPSLDTDNIAETIKTFFPVEATTTSFQSYPPAPPDLRQQDLRLSLQSFQDPIMLQHQPQSHNEPVLFAGTALGFDGGSAWSEHQNHHSEEHRLLFGGNSGHGGGFVFNTPAPAFGQFFSQRGPLQSSNTPSDRDWLMEHADESELNKLKWSYYLINKSPWSSLDDGTAFLTTADSAIKLLSNATKPVKGWKGLEYRAAFPVPKPRGANFYPPDMDKTEFETWKENLEKDQQKEATGFFSVIKRHSELLLDSETSHSKNKESYDHDLYIVPYSAEYKSLLTKAADLLQKAADITQTPSLKRLLHSKADAFLSNDYYESDMAWMDLNSKLEVTIGPYETYEDKLFGYKATFEAFVGIRDDIATSQLKLFGDNLQLLEQNLPLDDVYKSKDVNAAPIRVIQVIYNAGDVKGPQIVAFNLPNDERIVKDRGTAMVMLKNVSEAKFERILQPIAEHCVAKELQEFVDFESFFTHTICHECVHGIGPHSITLPNGQKSTVRLELQEYHSAMEEAKADIVGLWALRFLISKGLLSESLLKSIYVSFLAGCFRSVRFGLEEAHGKGQALQFNWLYEKGAFIPHSQDTISVDFSKTESAVESLSREILTIQAKGDKAAAASLLQKYGVISEPLKLALQKLEKVQVPVDIAPNFPVAQKILQ